MSSDLFAHIMTDVTYIVASGLVFMVIALLMIYWQLKELHKTMNSRLDELISTAKLLARAEGFREGQEDHLRQLRDFKED